MIGAICKTIDGRRVSVTHCDKGRVGDDWVSVITVDDAREESHTPVTADLGYDLRVREHLDALMLLKHGVLDADFLDKAQVIADPDVGIREALKALLHAVCGPTGFAAAVREDTRKAYPWPALDEAEKQARDAIGGL